MGNIADIALVLVQFQRDDRIIVLHDLVGEAKPFAKADV